MSSTIQLPPDSTGQYLPTVDVLGAGPAGADLAFPIGIFQQHNGIGAQIHIAPWAPMPTVITTLCSVACAIDALWFANTGVAVQNVYVDDGAGNTLLNIDLQPGQSFPWPLYSLPAVGLRWQGGTDVNAAARWYAAS